MPSPPRPWLPRAAVIYVDMERGLYPWDKQPFNGDGSYRVVRTQILTDCGVKSSYSGANKLIWSSEEFQRLLEQERLRRDSGIVDVVEKLEAVVGPVTKMGEAILKEVQAIFDRPADSEDPTALSPAQYVSEARQWYKLGLEVEGKLDSTKQQGVADVISKLYQGNQITQQMLDSALELVREHRDLEDRKMRERGVIDVGRT